MMENLTGIADKKSTKTCQNDKTKKGRWNKWEQKEKATQKK